MVISSIWTHRHLLAQLIRQDIRARYQGSLLGAAWSLVTPILMLLVYTFVFSVVFKARWGSDPGESTLDFAVNLFAGLIVFGVFSESVNRAPGLILANVNYVKKVIFPLEILSLVSLGSVLFHSLISLLVLLAVQAVLVGSLPWTIIFFPLILLPLLLASLGFSWFLSATAVYLRDIGQITNVFTTILMFLSAVFFPISALPSNYQVLRLNPVAIVIAESRKVLIHQEMPNWTALALLFVLGVLLAGFGFWWFNKTRKGFADVI
jgi:lipopolysaccharide transport system permease protein